jgi:hypothetical protein
LFALLAQLPNGKPSERGDDDEQKQKAAKVHGHLRRRQASTTPASPHRSGRPNSAV